MGTSGFARVTSQFTESNRPRIPNNLHPQPKNQIEHTMKTHNSTALASIVSKYSVPTNSRGARIIVKSQRYRRSYPYPYELSGEAVHVWAVDKYLSNLIEEDRKEYGSDATGWGTIADYSVGVLPTGEYVFVRNS
jgi:hypothetical protein